MKLLMRKIAEVANEGATELNREAPELVKIGYFVEEILTLAVTIQIKLKNEGVLLDNDVRQ